MARLARTQDAASTASQSGEQTRLNLMPDAQALLAMAEEIGAALDALLEGASTNDSDEARIAMCLCLTIAGSYAATLAVLRSRAPTHAPVLIRSMHEALADLRILVADPTHVDQMRFDNADQMLKTVKEFADDPDLRDDADAQATMEQWRATERPIYDGLKERGYKALGVLDTFKKAGMTRDYAGYRFLCSFTHNNLGILRARHERHGCLRVNDDLPLETLKSLLGFAISNYGRAIETLPNYTNLSLPEIKAAIEAADARWDRVNAM